MTIIRTAKEARGGAINHNVRYMLMGSLILVVVGMIVAFALT